uniref:Reverse transcriptase domain-containing protein n=1 Tax=Strongyloides venezuelensis TaxID=75913 RepID=A0A0K0EZQ5_STRVS
MKKNGQTIFDSELKNNRAMKLLCIEKREFNYYHLFLLKPDGSMATTIDEENEKIKRHYKDLYTGLPISDDWEKSFIEKASLILLKKPENAKLTTNTRPIAILQSNYKLFSLMLFDRIRNRIECNLDREQTGFRRRKKYYHLYFYLENDYAENY